MSDRMPQPQTTASSTRPSEPAPDEPPPDHSIPDQPLPEDSMPDELMRDQSMPDQSMPDQSTTDQSINVAYTLAALSFELRQVGRSAMEAAASSHLDALTLAIQRWKTLISHRQFSALPVPERVATLRETNATHLLLAGLRARLAQAHGRLGGLKEAVLKTAAPCDPALNVRG